MVVGAGFTGLAVAWHAARLLPRWETIVIEAEGGGASGRTGGVVLATNALSLDIMGQGRFLTAFNTFAIATAPVPRDRLAEGWWPAERAF